MKLYRFSDTVKGEVLVNTDYISEISQDSTAKPKIIMTNGNLYTVDTGDLDEIVTHAKHAAGL